MDVSKIALEEVDKLNNMHNHRMKIYNFIKDRINEGYRIVYLKIDNMGNFITVLTLKEENKKFNIELNYDNAELFELVGKGIHMKKIAKRTLEY